MAGGHQGSERGRDLPQITKGKHNGGARIHTQVWLPPVPTVPKQQGAGHVIMLVWLRKETQEAGFPEVTEQVTVPGEDPGISEIEKISEITFSCPLKVQLRSGKN